MKDLIWDRTGLWRVWHKENRRAGEVRRGDCFLIVGIGVAWRKHFNWHLKVQGWDLLEFWLIHKMWWNSMKDIKLEVKVKAGLWKETQASSGLWSFYISSYQPWLYIKITWGTFKNYLHQGLIFRNFINGTYWSPGISILIFNSLDKCNTQAQVRINHLCMVGQWKV